MFEAIFQNRPSAAMVSKESALAGRSTPAFTVPSRHEVLGSSLTGPWPENTQVIYLALGCFWGAEKLFWQIPGVVATASGYQGGFTPNPTYAEVCTGRTGHTETVLVAYNPEVVSTEQILATFWENHDPTQGFRQGNDVGTQYRSAVYWTTPEQAELVHRTYETFQRGLAENGYGDITTEMAPAQSAGPFYYAEADHQQYLHKVPHGYCPTHATGVRCG